MLARRLAREGQQAAYADGRLVGVAVAGRPVARALADGLTVEVTRVCTDGTRNACSALLGASRRVALVLGYQRGITYTLASEPGTSLRAALGGVIRGMCAVAAGHARVARVPTITRPRTSMPGGGATGQQGMDHDLAASALGARVALRRGRRRHRRRPFFRPAVGQVRGQARGRNGGNAT